MTASTADRIPLQDLRQIVRSALAQGDYEHDCEWINGGPVTVPTPEQHLVTLDILTASLTPDTEGTVGRQQAAEAVLAVITARLGGEYILRAHSLVKRLTREAEAWEQAHGTGVPEEASDSVPVSVLACQWCSRPIPVARGAKARFCKNGCRVMAARARKRERERERVNAAASPGR